MKRTLSLLLVCAMALSLLASCGGGKTSGGSASSDGSASSGEDGFSADLAQFYEDNTADAIEAGTFPMMMELDEETLENFYPGLTAIERKQTVAYVAGMSAVTCEVIMVEVADSKDVKAVQDIYQARIDGQVKAEGQYPETIENWQNHSVISTRGNYVCLFVMPPEFGDLAGAFTALENSHPPQKDS